MSNLPTYAKIAVPFSHTILRRNGERYDCDNGCWSVAWRFDTEGVLRIYEPNENGRAFHLHNLELIETTKEEYKEVVGEYAHTITLRDVMRDKSLFDEYLKEKYDELSWTEGWSNFDYFKKGVMTALNEEAMDDIAF